MREEHLYFLGPHPSIIKKIKWYWFTGGSAVVESVGEVNSPTFLKERWQSGPKYASSFETWALWLCVSLLVERQCQGP